MENWLWLSSSCPSPSNTAPLLPPSVIRISPSATIEMSSAGAQNPPRAVFLGIDVGTGSARAGLFNEEGRLLGSSCSPIQIWREGSCIEQSSTDIWHAVCTAVKTACSLADVAAEDVSGLGFAATCSLVAVDADDSPVSVSWSGDARRNTIVWMDHRAVEQAERINRHSSPVLQYCGGSISPEMQAPKAFKEQYHRDLMLSLTQQQEINITKCSSRRNNAGFICHTCAVLVCCGQWTGGIDDQ